MGDPVHDPDPVDVTGIATGERIHRNQRVNAQGYKIVPEVEIVRVESRHSGNSA